METGVDAHTSNLKTLEGRNRIVIFEGNLGYSDFATKGKRKGGNLSVNLRLN